MCQKKTLQVNSAVVNKADGMTIFQFTLVENRNCAGGLLHS